MSGTQSSPCVDESRASFEAMLEPETGSEAPTDGADYEPWDRKDLPTFEAPKDDEPGTEGSK